MQTACLTLIAACLLSVPALAAAQAPQLPVPLDPAMFTGLLKGYKDCRSKYAEMDARIDAAGVRDGAYYRVPGFPYFRIDRMAASFANEVTEMQDVAGWTRRMREFDQEAREFEYINLGMSGEEIGRWRYDLLACGGGLANLELFEEDNLAFLRKMAVPSSEYLPASAAPPPKLRKDIAARRAALLKAFTGPLPAAADKTPLKLWTAQPVEDLGLIAKGYGNALHDELGVPALIDSQWRALAEVNAPALWIETGGERDQPGTPALTADAVTVDPAQPAMNYHITFTRFGQARLTQINYFIWFKGRSGEAGADTPIDSLIWRVTLDAQARPLVYESVHGSGRDHLWFLAQPLERRAAATRAAAGSSAAEALFPQAGPVTGPVALRIAAGTHALRRVVPLATATAVAGKATYTLRRYEDLFALQRPDGSHAGLYGPDGTIPEIRETDLAWLWGDRIKAPGALRELGRLPVSYDGQQHFDDAGQLDRLFKVPSTGTSKPRS